MMKLSLYTLLVALLSTSFSFAQCNFYDIKNGTSITYEMKDGKGKSIGQQKILVKDYQATSGGFSAIMNTQNLDKKGKNIYTTDVKMVCENGALSMDMSKFLDEGQLKSFENLEIEMSQTNLELPAKLEEGQELTGAQMTVDVVSPIKIKMVNTISNRKVVSKEKVSTPAGTYDCYKISYDLEVAHPVGKSNSRVEEFWTEGVGMVQSISYKPNGKKEGSTVLSAFSK